MPIDQRYDITNALSALSVADIAALDVVLMPYELMTSRNKASQQQPPATRLKGTGMLISREAPGLAIESMPHQHK